MVERLFQWGKEKTESPAFHHLHVQDSIALYS
jgi:hypothetical protein